MYRFVKKERISYKKFFRRKATRDIKKGNYSYIICDILPYPKKVGAKEHRALGTYTDSALC